MAENLLIPLPGFELPRDFPWQVGFVGLVNTQLRKLRATGHFEPPRFFGYYLQGHVPVGVGGSWTVSLEPTHPAMLLPQLLEPLTHGLYSIVGETRDTLPDFMLVHDRQDGACWLWTFAEGLRFVEATDAVHGGGSDFDDADKPKLWGRKS